MSETEANIKQFEPKICSNFEVDMELKGKTIDFKKTLKKIMSKDIGIAPEGMVSIISEKGFHNLEATMNEYDIELFSEEFYDKLDELRNEGKSIYVHTVYATDEIGGHDTVYEYDIDDDGSENIGICSYLGSWDLRLNSEYYHGNMEGDYGIMFEGNKISFGRYEYCFGPSVEPMDMYEPLDRFAAEIMLDIIEFENA